jgi:hypothetical protein
VPQIKKGKGTVRLKVVLIIVQHEKIRDRNDRKTAETWVQGETEAVSSCAIFYRTRDILQDKGNERRQVRRPSKDAISRKLALNA